MNIMEDGHSTIISFSANPAVKFAEKEVTPPAVSGGGPVDTTTMRNQTWRTQGARKLKTLGQSSAVVAYDPLVYDQIVAMVNVNQQITVTFPDGESVTFWGWLDSFTPGANVEGTQPTATITIEPSNRNTSKQEQAPDTNAGSGSGA